MVSARIGEENRGIAWIQDVKGTTFSSYGHGIAEEPTSARWSFDDATFSPRSKYFLLLSITLSVCSESKVNFS